MKTKQVQARKDDIGDVVLYCSNCGRLAIGYIGEDYERFMCDECGNNEWKTLPFEKKARVRVDPNDSEPMTVEGGRKRRVDSRYVKYGNREDKGV